MESPDGPEDVVNHGDRVIAALTPVVDRVKGCVDPSVASHDVTELVSGISQPLATNFSTCCNSSLTSQRLTDVGTKNLWVLPMAISRFLPPSPPPSLA